MRNIFVIYIPGRGRPLSLLYATYFAKKQSGRIVLTAK